MKKKRFTIKPLSNAQRLLVEKFYPMAQNLGKKFAGLGESRGVPCEDLQQEAAYGLCIAAQMYKKNKDTDFQTYAYGWCCKYIRLAIRDQAPLLSPEGDAPEETDEDEEMPDDDPAMEVRALLKVLNKQQKMVVCLIYGVGCKQLDFKSVAKKLHITPARVHQIYEQSLNILENYGESND